MQKSESTHFHGLDKLKMQYKQPPQHGQLKNVILLEYLIIIIIIWEWSTGVTFQL